MMIHGKGGAMNHCDKDNSLIAVIGVLVLAWVFLWLVFDCKSLVITIVACVLTS
jgi:hypothetical protein